MFNEAWFWLAVLVLIAGLALGDPALLALSALLATAGPVTWLWSRFALYGVEYERTLGEVRAFVDEEVPVTFSLTNRKWLPLAWVQLHDSIPDTLAPTDVELEESGLPSKRLLNHITALGWYERINWQHSFRCKQRGFYFFGPATLKASDFFGLFETQVDIPTETRLIVYPKIEEMEELGLPAKDPFGVNKADTPIFEDPTRTIGVHDYFPEDPLKRVHWKATARMQELKVRVWEPSEAQQVMIVVNVATFAKYWEGIDPKRLERIISVAASTAMHVWENKHVVGIIANAAVPRSDQTVRVMPGRSPNQMRDILEALAAVTGFALMPVSRLLQHESTRIPWGATVVVVTAVVTEDLLVTLMDLRRVGRRVALVSLDTDWESDERLEGIVVHHVAPFD